MVVDTSATLALLFDEPHAAWVAEKLNEHAEALMMSTVNLTECFILTKDRQPGLADELRDRLLKSGIRFIPPNVEQAKIAAEARLRFPLNLGDCFAYALASSEDDAILTLDAGFKKTDRPVIAP